jgi:hypothetical protein
MPPTRDDSVELEFAIDIFLFDLDISRSINLCGRHVD